MLSGAQSSYLSKTAVHFQMWSSYTDWWPRQTQRSVGLSSYPREDTSLLLCLTCAPSHLLNTARRMHRCSRSLRIKAIIDMLSGALCLLLYYHGTRMLLVPVCLTSCYVLTLCSWDDTGQKLEAGSLARMLQAKALSQQGHRYVDTMRSAPQYPIT